MARLRGQALVEFALILPIFLMLMIGAFEVSHVLSEREELRHAAREGAIAGASEPGPPRRCINALDVAVRVLAREPTAKKCSRNDQQVIVTLTDRVPIAIPFFPANNWKVVVIERAEVRR